MTGRACRTVRQTWPCFAALDRSRLLRPDTSPPWNSPPASPRSFSTTTGPDFGLTGPAGETHAGTPPPSAYAAACRHAVQDAVSNLKGSIKDLHGCPTFRNLQIDPTRESTNAGIFQCYMKD